MWNKLKKRSEFLDSKIDGVVWYSPTIFWGPLIKRLKQRFHVKSYLILRDISHEKRGSDIYYFRILACNSRKHSFT